MKYFKRLGIYKNSTGSCKFNPSTREAFSYNWWQFLKVINGKLVFNKYSYSVTTSRHQSEVLRLLSQENIKIDLYICAPKGLQTRDGLQSAIDWYKIHISVLLEKIKKPKTHKKTNINRYRQIAFYELKIAEVEALKNDNDTGENIKLAKRKISELQDDTLAYMKLRKKGMI